MATGVNVTLNRTPPPPVAEPKFKVALCQLEGGPDKDLNIARAKDAIAGAAAQGARMVVLPEVWNSPYTTDSFPKYAEEVGASGDDSPSTAMLSAAAREHGVVLVGGSIPERHGTAIYNTCFVYDSRGGLLARHRKVHLFDIDIPGKITFRESETLTPGASPTVVDTELGRVAVAICYDLRFPELAALYAARGAQILVYPGAFNLTTGPAHWELLLRARAVDNQMYVAGVSPARDMNASYHAWGHSMLVDPFGRILAEAGEGAATLVAEVDLAQVDENRRNVPYNAQKRGDLYALHDLTREG